MFVVLKKHHAALAVTPQSDAEPCDFLRPSFSKRCVAAFVAQTKRAAADQAAVWVGRAGGRGW